MITPGTTRTELLISGMRGNGCREQVTGVLESVAGVRSVDVSLYRARASIFHDQRCDSADLIRAVLEAGYRASLAGRDAELGPQEAHDGQDQC